MARYPHQICLLKRLDIFSVEGEGGRGGRLGYSYRKSPRCKPEPFMLNAQLEKALSNLLKLSPLLPHQRIHTYDKMGIVPQLSVV